MKYVDVAVYNAVKSVKEGTFKGGEQRFGVKEGGVGTTEFEFADGIIALKSQNSLGKLIALGAVINVILFFGLLKFNKELI